MSTKSGGGSSRRIVRDRTNRRWKTGATSGNPVERAFNRVFNAIRARQN